MGNDRECWYALRTRKALQSEALLKSLCEEVFLPKETVRTRSGIDRCRPFIPNVVFIRTSRTQALRMEKEAREGLLNLSPFWIYRNASGNDIQPVSDKEIRLLRLLTASDKTRCEIFNKSDFKKGELVRVTGGIYEGYSGMVQRVKKNKHVIVQIEGICMVMLPFIHPDLLEPVNS